MTNDDFGLHLGVAVRTVAKWNAKPDLVPGSELQRALDTALARAAEDAKDRFTRLSATTDEHAAGTTAARPHAVDEAVGLRLNRDPAIDDALHWLDRQAGWSSGEARRRVKNELATLDMDSLQDRVYRRGEVKREQVADALASYYARGRSQHGFYGARCGSRIVTSILTRPEWLDLRIALGDGKDDLAYLATAAPPGARLDDVAANSAVARLAEILAVGTRLVNAPLYSLRSIDVWPQGLNGVLGLTNFVEYALTLDLLETELVDALSCGQPMTAGALPLRDRYLPTAAALIDMDRRLCAGGPLALMAIARPARWHGREPDYVLLVQERSGRVLNSARRLAVVPKAFHRKYSEVV